MLYARTEQKKKQPLGDEFFKRKSIYELFGFPAFPYQCHLSFEPLIRFWEEQVHSSDESIKIIAREIHRRLKSSPELHAIIKDINTLNNHPALVDLLISGFLPGILEGHALARISSPFNTLCFYETPEIAEMVFDETTSYHFPEGPNNAISQLIVYAGNLILNRCYQVPFAVSSSFPFSVAYENTPIQKHFKGEINLEFVDVEVEGPLPDLSDRQIKQLRRNFDDINPWLETFPPDKYSFVGVGLTTLFDSTEIHTISQLELSLLERNALLEKNKIKGLQNLLCSFFQLSDLKLGISAINYPNPNTVPKYPLQHFLLQDYIPNHFIEEIAGSIYEDALFNKEIILIEDLQALPNQSSVIESLIDAGFRSLLIAPLLNQHDQIIGLLELGSPHVDEISQLIKLRIKEFTGLFGIAVERVRKEIDNHVDAIIRKEFTSIHPSVEWRFEENALKLMGQMQSDDKPTTMEPIIFKDIYPLYGQADIVGSTKYRNEAIQYDLLENLRLAHDVLKKCSQVCVYPSLDQIAIEAMDFSRELKENITSSHEFHIVEFLKKEVHPVLHILKENSSQMNQWITGYFEQLEPSLGIVYKKRKDYEQSVSFINTTISELLDKEQENAQKIIPHFYDKYQTDGVAYNIYAGQSLLQRGTFLPSIHLTNLRLWQLISLCKITQKLTKLQAKQSIPLTTAQLILVHSTPLSIRFRMDEKRFDVDGTYNARYEIVKKRIDKAYVKGTDQRLTLAGKIAIVFQFEEDKKEYLRYINYLQKIGLITNEIEELDLEKLQGVQGLNALRITVSNE